MLKDYDTFRFFRLLSEALASPELKLFFYKNRTKLIHAGAKVQNLPADRVSALQALLRMPERAFEIFRQYYLDSYVRENLKTSLEVASSYREHLDSKTLPEVETIRPLAEMVLYHLFSNDCPDELSSIFSRTANEKSKKIPSGEVAKQKQPTSQIPELYLIELRELIVRLIGSNSEVAPAGLSADSLAFVSALSALQKRDVRLARQHQQSISEENPRFGLIEDAIDQILIEIGNADPKYNGIRKLQPIMMSSSDEFIPEESDILGCCSVSHNGTDSTPSFIKVIGVWSSDQLYIYPEDVLNYCLPEHGELIAYETSKSVKRPYRGEVGIWKVEPVDNAGSPGLTIQYKLKRQSGEVYEIFDIPNARTEYDAIRDAIKAFRTNMNMRPIFRTSDGLLLKTKREFIDFTKNTFDDPLLAWKNLTVFEWDGRRFFIGKLPIHDQLHDCSDIDRVLPSLLRYAVQTEKIALSRTDAQVLVDLVVQNRSEIDPNRGRIIGENLRNYLDGIENLNTVIEVVMNYSKVKAEIDAAKERVALDVFKARADLIDEASRLKSEISTLERTMQEKREELARLPHDVSSKIKSAFDKAVGDGVDTLTQVGLLSAFIRSDKTIQIASISDESSKQAAPIHETQRQLNAFLVPAQYDLNAVLISCGIPKPSTKTLLSSIDVALEAGLVVVLSGIAAPTFARRLAVSRAKIQVQVNSIEVGATLQQLNSSEIRDPARLWDVILLQNFNHAPQESYANDLFEMALSQILDGPIDRKIQIIATYTKGLSGLPISPGIRKFCFVVDLDKKIAQGLTTSLEDWEEALLDESDDSTKERPWPVTVKRLADVMRTNMVDHPDVYRLLETGISSDY